VPAYLVAASLALSYLLLVLPSGRGEMQQMLLVQVRAPRALEAQHVVSGLGGDLGRGAGREFKVRDVINRNGDAVLLAPILGEGIEPGVVLGNEMAPLQDFEGLGLGEGVGYEWR